MLRGLARTSDSLSSILLDPRKIVRAGLGFSTQFQGLTISTQGTLMKHCLFGVAFTMLLVATISCFAYAQGTSSSLSGVVLDQSGGVVPGADVKVKNDATGIEFDTITVENGTFSIPALDAGTYTATIEMAGFKQAIVKDVKLVAAAPSTIRVSLQVGGSNETVTVVANA
jgi:hypothetical protein